MTHQNEESNTSSGWRLPALDGVRGVAALSVLVGHAAQEAGSDGRTLIGAWLRYGGQGGVVLFFVLSGFLLFLPWLKPHPPTFRVYAARRCLRIMPAYYVSVLAMALFFRPGAVPILFHLLFLPSFTFTLLPVYWTLQVEEFFYWSLPVLAMVVKRFGAGLTVAFSVVLSVVYASAVLRVVPPKYWFLLLSQTPFYLPAFAGGLAAAVAWRRGVKLRWAALSAPFSYLLVAPIAEHYRFVSATVVGAKIALPISNLVLVPGVVALVLSAAGGAQEWLAARPLRFVGKISFSLYLWHYVVIKYVPIPTALSHSVIARVAHALIFSLPIAYLGHRFVEMPFLKLRPGSPAESSVVPSIP